MKLIIILAILVTAVEAQKNQAPVWKNTLDRELGTGIREDRKIGYVIGRLVAEDPEGVSDIEYLVDSDTLNVNLTTGEVTLAHLLDYENKANGNGNPLTATFTAREKNGRNSVPVTVTIVVNDVNDNAPEFLGSPYNFQVPENAIKLHYDKIQVTDRDSGYNAEVRLSCYQPAGDIEARAACQKFYVNYTFDASTKLTSGVVHLREAVDYEKTTSFIMTIMAKDNGYPSLNSTVNVHIVVEDQQDRPPEFTNVPITFYVKESEPMWYPVGNITASDGDVGIARPVRITLYDGSFTHTGLQPGMFTLGSTRAYPNSKLYYATVYTNYTLDRETNARYEFNVKAVEVENGLDTNTTTTTTVAINIMDVNDNTPSFEYPTYSVNVLEVRRQTDRKTIPYLAILASDPDETRNAQFRVEVVRESFPGSVTVFPNVTVTNSASFYLRIDNKYLDFEIPAYRMQTIVLKAIEVNTVTQHPKFNITTVHINVTAINDHSPQFAQKLYTVNVTENTLPIAPIITITATDADLWLPDSKKINYTIHGVHSSWFRVESNTGKIYLDRKLDYEYSHKIILVYWASDQGSPTLKGKTLIQVNVDNVNDIAPVFATDYVAEVQETSIILKPDIIIVAQDPESGTAEISYAIIAGNTQDNAFVLNSRTGRLILTRRLSTSESVNGSFVLVVKANDNGVPNLSNTTKVTIIVKDENTQDPIFVQLVYRKKVNETAGIGDFVVKIYAKDKDTGANGEVRYKIHHTMDVFKVNERTGDITVSGKLNYDTFKSYEIRAVATDSGSPSRSGSADVFITIIDKNNQPPVFTPDIYEATVDESQVRPAVVWTVRASDPDTDSNLFYSIDLSSIEAFDSKHQPFTDSNTYDYINALAIRSSNGDIYINKYLRYEYVAQIRLTVKVEDRKSVTGAQIDTAKVTISISKKVDLSPYFDTPWTVQKPKYFYTIDEEITLGTVVRTLVATEPQSGNTKRITNFEKIANSDLKNYFTVRRATGEIVINKRIDFEALSNKILSFQVKAISADVSRSAHAIIDVQISDINDHLPIFTPSVGYHFYVPENSGVTREVGRVLASDDDSGMNGELAFSIIGNRAEDFTIHKNGLVTVAAGAIIDREVKAEYSLKVEARDRPGQLDFTSTRVALKITVQDLNDNRPQFLESNYTFYMVDTLPTGTSIGEVAAHDPDEGSNGQFFFSAKSADYNNATKLVYVNPTTGIVSTIDESTRYDFNHELRLHVTARDFGTPPQQSTVTMTIIRDTRSKDGKPIFTFPSKGSISKKLYENATLNDLVETAQAASARGTNYTIEYSFDTFGLNADYKNFLINLTTGAIRVNALLDREVQQDYELRIRASDITASPVTENVELLVVRLQDINDNRPKFGQLPCSTEFVSGGEKDVFVKENSVPGMEVVTVSACDRDIAPNNVITYSLNPAANQTCDQTNLFRIRPSTSIIETSSNNGELIDFEKQSKHLLCLEASDGMGKPDLTYIWVNVLDANDNRPKFTMKFYSTVIVDTISRGEVTMTLKAIDKDQGENARVLYHIKSITFHYQQETTTDHHEAFLINPLTGQLTTAMSPYTEFTSGYFLIQVIVYDYHNNSMFDAASITVAVIDDSYLMKAVVKTKENEVPDVTFKKKWQQELDKSLNAHNWTTDITEVKYHTDDEQKIDIRRIDMCFVTTKNSGQQVVSGEEVDTVLGQSSSFTQSDTVSVQPCMQYKHKDEVSPYWWVLVAFAIFIFLALIILIAIFVILSNRFQKQQETSIQMVPSS